MDPKTHFKLVRTGDHCHYGKPVATGDEIEAPVGVAREMLALKGEWKLAEGEEVPPAPPEPESEAVQTSAQADATHDSSHPRRARGHK